MWIFGYGSLVFRPAFPYVRREPAVVRGWVRRFWQGSTDHRGIPGAPGRVVTLVPERCAHSWGMAYLLDENARARVMAKLDRREQGGYTRHALHLELPRANEEVRAIVYVAGSENPNYLGPASLEHIASVVRRSRGPSGDNREYLTELHRALHQMGAHDAHVRALFALLLRDKEA